MSAVQTVSKLKSHLNFQSHPLERLQAKPKSSVVFLPRVKEINRLQYRLIHGDIQSLLGCMVPKLNRANKQVSVASLKAVCSMFCGCQIAQKQQSLGLILAILFFSGKEELINVSCFGLLVPVFHKDSSCSLSLTTSLPERNEAGPLGPSKASGVFMVVGKGNWGILLFMEPQQMQMLCTTGETQPMAGRLGV